MTRPRTAGKAFRLQWRESRWSALGTTATLTLWVGLMVGLWPAVRDSVASIRQLWERYPEALKTAFGVSGVDPTTYAGFIASELLGVVWPLFAIGLAVGVSAGISAGELERGTLELLLAAPVDRGRLLLGRAVALGTMLFVLTATSWVAIGLGAPLVGERLDAARALWAALEGLALAGFSLGVGLAFTVACSRRSQALLYASGVMLLLYMVNIIGSLWGRARALIHLTPFHAYAPGPALAGDATPVLSVVVPAAVGVVLVGFSWWWFRRMDISA